MKIVQRLAYDSFHHKNCCTLKSSQSSEKSTFYEQYQPILLVMSFSRDDSLLNFAYLQSRKRSQQCSFFYLFSVKIQGVTKYIDENSTMFFLCNNLVDSTLLFLCLMVLSSLKCQPHPLSIFISSRICIGVVNNVFIMLLLVRSYKLSRSMSGPGLLRTKFRSWLGTDSSGTFFH